MGARLNQTGPATPLHAVAAILVLVATSAIQVRLDPSAGWLLLLYVVGSAIVAPWALAAAASETREDRPSGITTTLLLSALSLILSALLSLADALGAEGGSGSTLWVSLVFAAIAGFPGWRLNSPVCALLSSAALGVAFFAAIDLLFGLDSVDTGRWLLLVLAIAYAAVAALLLNSRYRHAVQHVTAAGLAVTGLVLLSFGDIFASAFGAAFIGGSEGDVSFNGPVGWELIGLLTSGAVLAFGVIRREIGPGLTGALALSSATGLAAFPDTDASLIGWPILFLVLALAAVGAVFVQGGATLPGNLGGRGGSRARPSGSGDTPPPPPPPPGASTPPPGPSAPPPGR